VREAANINFKRLPFEARWLGIILPFLILTAGSIIGIYNLPDSYLLYFVGDFYVISQFIIIGCIFSLKKMQDYSDRIFWGYFAAMVVVSISEFYFSYTKHYADVDRFVPFDILFVITCAWFAFYRLRFVPLVLLIGLVASYARSGMRLGFFLSVFMPCLIFFASRRKIFRADVRVLRGAIVIIAAAAVAWFYAPEVASLKTISRIRGTFQGQEGEMVGVNSRFSEAKTAISEQLSKPVIEVIFGSGHGGLYKKFVAWDLAVNLTPKGTHNIHMSPALFFFRYGLLGFAWYLLILLYAISRATRIMFLQRGETINDCMAISNLYLCALLLSSIIGQNNFIYMDIPIMLYLTANYEKAHRSKCLEQKRLAEHYQPAY